METFRYESRTGENFQCSDHRPVSCDFLCITSKLNSDEGIHMTYPAVKFFPSQIDETIVDWSTNIDEEIRLCIPYEEAKDAEELIDGWDWIGIYHENFTSLEDYVTFTWAVKYPQCSNVKKAFITTHYIMKGRNYVAVYMSAKSSVLGVSEAFEI